jgi:hypothetical protein
MEKQPQEKTLADIRWVPLDGAWENKEPLGLEFTGGEFDPPKASTAGATAEEQQGEPQKFIKFGTLLFNQNFKEGHLRMLVEFDAVDHRSSAAIVIQYDPATKDMLTFAITGGGLKYAPGVTGFLYKLQLWGASPDRQQQGTAGTSKTPKKWTSLFEVGLGVNLKARQAYELGVSVRGSVATLFVDGVEIGKHTLEIPFLIGNPCGIFCGSHENIHIREFSVKAATPTAFVVMQFQPPEYEALFKDVIEPVCKAEGLQAYRADSTYMPGLVIEDIKRQIAECRVVIAEITPGNPNVYYEVGYADALNKPLILIADRREGLKPFDVRAYRTIFYENSIGGKNAVEKDLRLYLQGILNK